jgi:predicted DCC family thiol-disulfide oxidoreductase YuxK
VTAIFDADCGVCFQIARVLARMDLFQRIRWVSSAEVPADLDVSPELLARTMVAVDRTSGRRATRADGMALVLRALPLGLLWSAPLRVPGLRRLANLAYDAFSRSRRTISVWLGLAACVVPTRRVVAVAPVEGAAAEPPPEEGAEGPVYVPEISAESRTPMRAWLGRAAWILREGTVLAMLIVLVNETLFINQAVPKPLRFDEPGWVKRLVAYPRLIQAWSMFASDAPMSDLSMVVDATTADGRHVDPYSETSGRYARPGLSGIPPRLDNSSFFFNYSMRLPEQGSYNQAFIEWILRYPERTGNVQDRIVRFDAYTVEQDSPPPGETTPRNIRSHKFLSYP